VCCISRISNFFVAAYLALDNESESIVQAALDKLMALNDRTVVVIAHRVCSVLFASLFFACSSFSFVALFHFLCLQLSTIRNANRIAFISDGRVKEIGCVDVTMCIFLITSV
jgi:hypothetical protein